MKNNRTSWIKRTVALMLTVSLVLSSAVEIVPGRYAARAEDIQESQAAPQLPGDVLAVPEVEEVIVEVIEPDEAAYTAPDAPVAEPVETPVEAEPAAPEVEQPVEAEPVAPEVEQPVETVPVAPEVEQPAETEPAAPEAEQPVEAEPVAPEAEQPAETEPVTAPDAETPAAPETEAPSDEADQPAAPFDAPAAPTAPVTASEAAQDAANSNEETAAESVPAQTSEAPEETAQEGEGGSEDKTPAADADENKTLQELIKEKISTAASLNERITLILKKDKTYSGDVEIKKESDKTYGDDFGIDLVSETAVEDNLQGDGSTVIAGTVTIQGISVKIAGIGIAAGKKVTVSEATLDYYGTKGGDTLDVEAKEKAVVNASTGDGADNVTVSASGGAKADIRTGAGDDTLTATVTGAELTADTGDGDDTVTANLTGGAKAEIQTGEGNDKATVGADDAELTLGTGDGDDEVTANLGAGVNAEITTGDGGDTVTLAEASDQTVSVDTGSGKDKVTVDARVGMRNLNITTGEGRDKVTVGTTSKDISGSPVGDIQIDMGGDIDETTVDLGIAAAVRDVKVVGGEGSDHLRFTGELDEDTAEADRITGSAESMTFAGSRGELNVATETVETMTDELENKQTVKLTPGASGTIVYAADKPFTNYVLNAPASDLKNVVITSKDGKDLVLSGVIIDTPTTVKGENKLVINEDTTIDVGNLHLIMKARNIEVNGTIKAGVVDIEATDGTGMYTRSYADLFNYYNGGSELSVRSPGAAVVAGLDKLWDYVNINDKATIVIGEKAAVYSSGDVILISKVEQTAGLISALSGINLVDVKIAHATIDVAGKIYAGYDAKANESVDGIGSVTMDASVSTTMGYDSKNKELGGLPLAVSVANTEAAVNVRKGAVVEAGKDVSASSSSELKVATRADSGLGGLPAAIAVSVLINDAKTSVDGAVTAKAGSVKVDATGKISDATIADKGAGQKSISGGYVAVAVALQDVKAELAKNAVVTANGGVSVNSTAIEKVNTHATAGEQSAVDGADGKSTSALDAINMVMGLWDNIKNGFGDDPGAKDKIDGAMKKLAHSSNSVRLDDQADRKGTVKVETTNLGNEISVSVNVEPWPSYRVKKITLRGLMPGENKYSIYTAEKSSAFTLPMQAKDLTVFVEYEEIESDEYTDTAADLFEERQEPEEDSDAALYLYGDVTNSINDPGDDDDDDEIVFDNTTGSINDVDDDEDDDGAPAPTPAPSSGNEDEDPQRDPNLNGNGLDPIDLELTGSGGAVLTYETKDEAGKEGESLDKVYKGDKIRLVPNPGENKKLKDGGLTVVYWVEDGDKLVSKKVIVNPDDQNRYYFTVPQDLDIKSGIQVEGTFVDTGVEDKKADETQTQLTGTVAVTVAKNDNQAIIAEGAVVKAGGSVSVNAETHTNVTNTADGTASGKSTGSGSGDKKDEDLKIKRPDSQDYAGFDEDSSEAGQAYPLYALRLDATENGKVTFAKAEGSANYKYTFTAVPDEGYSVAKAVLVVYKDGEPETIELEGKNGVYTVDLSGVAGKGTLSQVAFTFAKEGTYGEVGTRQAAQTVIPNAIRVSFNKLKNDNDEKNPISIGKIAYRKTETKDGAISAYVFSAEPDTAKGYVLDGNLKAEWTDASGAAKSKELTKKSDGSWSLDPSGIPAGAMITVKGAFKADMHDFKVNTDKTKDGKITLYDDKVKRDDSPKFTVKPDAGFSLDDVVVTINGKTELKLSSGALVKAKDKDGKELENVYTLKEGLPALKTDSEVSVSASFNRKGIGVFAGVNDTDKNIKLSEQNVAGGDKVTVSLSDEKAKAGYKVSKLVVKDQNDQVIYEGSADSFTVPKTTENGAKLTVTATLAEKTIALEGAKLTGGEVKPNVARADRGDVVTVTVKPDANFKVKTGTLKAVIKAKDGTYTEEAYMARSNDTTYTFIMPSSISDPSKVEVSFTGEFEPGQSDSSAVETSLGVGIAVNVTNSESRAEIRGDVTAKGGVTAKSTQEGGAKTEAKAGYSKGKIGVGGAVAVQVASLDSKALIYKTAKLQLDGALSVSSAVNAAFAVTGDASGSKAEAEKTGVGAGIAVAVNGSDAFAAVQDGAKISANTAESARGVSVSAEQKSTDIVAAKAGAAGGTAAVPVAAVDVAGISSQAYMGKVDSQNKLKLSDSAKVSATANVGHTISADASAAGKGAGIGGAFTVSVLSDSAKAQLAQSVEAKTVTVSTETVSKVESTATASASGGEKKAKQADKQSDSLLGAGGKLAGKNKSSGVSTGKVDNAIKNRQKAETSEGSVGVAGAIVVNVQSSESVSEVLPGVNIKATGDVAVTALNGTTSKVKANASVTKSNIGVGVGVAVNIVSLNNIANLSDGEIEAAALTVTALTKETPPKSSSDGEKKKEDPVETKDGLAKQLGEKVTGYVYDLASEIGLDSFVSKDLLDKILQPLITDTVQTLLDATGLDTLLGTGTLSDKYDAAKGLLLDEEKGLIALPEKLIQPMLSAMEEAEMLGTMTQDEIEDMLVNVKDEFVKQLKNNFLSKDTLNGLLGDVKDGMIDYLKDNVAELLSGVFEGKLKDTAGNVTKELGKQIAKTAKSTLKTLLANVFKSTMQAVDVPGLNKGNVDKAVAAFKSLKNAYDKDSFDKILTNAGEYITTSFREQVFDYEKMFKALTAKDLKTKISDGIRKAAKDAAVTLTNEMIGGLTNKLGVVLEAEQEDSVGHVIDTQAIAGTGAKDVGIAGSVAITVLNATTAARIGENAEGKITVANEMKVEAVEKRSVKNVASAALDAKGNAADNKKAEGAANADVGDGNSGKSKASANHVTMESGVGATLNILTGDLADAKPKVRISLKEGYKLPTATVDGEADTPYAEYTYTNKEGFEVTGRVAVKKDATGYYVDPTAGELSKADKDTDVALTLSPVEVLHGVPAPDVSLTDVSLEEGAVTISAKEREVKDGKLMVRPGEKVEVHVAKKAGREVVGIGYSFVNAKGERVDVEAIPVASSNGKEIVYTFDMPDAEVTDFVVSFVKSDKEEEPETAAKDGSGTSVGVGASFSMVYGDTEVTAQVGKRSELSAGAVTVKADTDHKENIASAAGSDPMSGETDLDATKDFALDAAVSLNILDNHIKAEIGQGTTVKTTGYEPEAGAEKTGDLSVTANEKAATETVSSSFAVGGDTAIGASVAVNIASTTVNANLASGATVFGSAQIGANSHSEDKTSAMATAMGADIARNLAKAGEKADNLEKQSSDLLKGDYAGKKDESKSTDTSKKITNKLNDKNKKAEDGDNANSGDSVSTNVLRSQGVKVQTEDAGKDGTDEANKQVNETTDQKLNDVTGKKEEDDSKWQVAAAVGLTIASHEAAAVVGQITAGKEIKATAENTSNFATMGTGAAMSLADHANSIAAGIAVSVNSNRATVEATGDLVSEGNGDVTVTSKLTQNMDGEFAGKLAAQALSGSAAGKDSTISLAGAISVVVAKGVSSVTVAGGTKKDKRDIQGGNVVIEATDKSKAAARAGGLSLSKGASVGMGVSSTTIVSNNTVTASVGDFANIVAGSFKLNAEKKQVTFDDYQNQFGLKSILTDSSKLNSEQRKNADTGLIDIHKGEDDKSYSVDVNLSSEKLMSAVDALNVLSSQNIYAEAIAGSITASEKDTSASLAGSFAVAVSGNKVNASLGENAYVELTRDDEHDGSMTVNAANGNTARIIAGSLSAAPAAASVGATVAVLVDKNEVRAETGDDAEIDVDGDFIHNAETDGDIQVFTAAMSTSTAKAGTAVGGAINVIVTGNTAESSLGSVEVTSGGSARVTSKTEFDLMAISGSASASAGSGVAAGGTINVIVDSSKSLTSLGAVAEIEADQDVTVASDVSDQMISGTTSLSAASKGSSGAGVVNVVVSKSVAETKAGRTLTLKATHGDLAVTANNDAWMLNASLAAAGAKNSAIGAGFNINVFNREATVDLSGRANKLTAGGDLAVQASGKDTSIIAGLVMAAAKDNALGGNFDVMVENNKIKTSIGENSTLTAGNNALVESYFSDFTVAAAGTIALSAGSGTNAGATSLTVVKNNEIINKLAKTAVTASAEKGALTAKSGDKVKGVYVGANAKETQFVGAAGVAAGTGTSINGEIVVMVNNNKVITDAATAILEAKANDSTVTVKAQDDTWQTLLAGGVNASLSSPAIGAALVVMVSNKTVEAKAHDMTAGKDVNVIADNHDELFQLALSAGVSGSGSAVQLGADIQVLKSTAKAIVASNVTARNGDFNLQASNDTGLTNASAAVAGSGGGAAVAPVAAVTYFRGSAEAILDYEANLNVTKGSANIKATSNKEIGMYTVGVAVSGGSVGLSGAANILVSNDSAQAIARGTEEEKDENGNVIATHKGVEMKVGGDVNVSSVGDYKLRTASASIAGSSNAGVAVNAVVSRMKSQTLSSLGGITTAGGAVNVDAEAKRDIINTIATVGVGGSAGVGVAVMVLAAGSKMSQDAADMIAYGNASKKDEKNKSGLDAGTLMKTVKENGLNTKYIDDEDLSGDTLASELEGNGHRESDTKVGHKDEGSDQIEFNGTSGYLDDDFKDQEFNNNGEMGRGEDLTASDTGDIDHAKNLNTYTYSDSDLPDDGVIARITGDAEISADAVAVSATQPTAADLFGVEIAVGGTAGVGVSASVAVLRSNVSASSAGYIKKATKGVSITATSKGSTDAKDAGTAERDSKLKEIMSALNPANRAIRVIGMTAAVGGEAGVAVAASVLLTDSLTQAKLGGRVENAASVAVKADHNYDNVMAATVAIGAGAFAGVAASVSVAQANGTVTSEIGSGAMVSTTGDVTVESNSTVDVNALAATASAGLGAFNGGVGLAINRLTQNTGIRDGANVTAGGNIKVNGVSDTTANAFLAGVSVGAVAAGLNAAVTDLDAKINTFIGESGDSKETAIVNAAGDIEISNDVHSAATPEVVSLAAGLAALGGNALLAFNNTDARAVLTNASLRAKDVTVVSDLAGEARSSLASLTIGGIAIGVSVNYADIQADNRAVVDTDGGALIVDGNLNVRTGVGEHNSTIATADTVSAEVGLATASLNAAIARNHTKNYAIITGSKPLTVHGDLFVHAAGQSTANSKLHGISYALGNVAATAVVALNDADTRTQVGEITEVQKSKDEVERVVKPLPSLTVDGTAYFDATQKGETNANVITGGGNLLGTALTVALAYGKTRSLVDVELTGDANLGGIRSTNLASDDVNSDIRNSAFSAISMSALYGAAYSQDVYNTTIRLSEGNFEIGAKGVELLNDYDAKANANVTPSTGGVSASLGTLSTNVAMAKSTAHAGANFEALKGTTHVVGDVKVLTRGSANTDSSVTTAQISASALAMGANIAQSDLSTVQAAYLRVGGTLNVDGGVDVQSVVKNLTAADVLAIKREKLRQWQKEKRSIGTYTEGLETEEVDDAWLEEDVDKMADERVSELYKQGGGSDISTGGAAQAKAKIGASGRASDAVKVSLVGGDFNAAHAKENMANTAAIVGGPYGVDYIEVEIDKGHFEEQETSYFDYEVVSDDAYIVRDEEGNPVMTTVTKTDDKTGKQVTEVVPKWDTGRHHPWVTGLVDVWIPNKVKEKVKQDLYDASKNVLTAKSLNMFSGAQNNAKTIAAARTDGAKNIGLFTAGGLDARASSNDTFSLLFEGMTATITENATLTAVGDTVANAVGFTPGGITLADASTSEVLSGVGTSDDAQTVAVIIGKDNSLIAGQVDVTIKNLGNATASLDQDTSYSLGSMKRTTQPTQSWYSTLFSMGSGAHLEATKGNVTINTSDVANATSTVSAKNKSLLMNFNSMMGKNHVKQTTNVDIGNGASVKASEDVNITADQRTVANAQTTLSGCGVLEGTTAKAQNDIKRIVRTNIGNNATVEGKQVNVLTVSGRNDNIYTKAYVEGNGFISMSNAKAYGDVESHSEITMGSGVTVSGTDLVSLVARSTSYRTLGASGVKTEGIVDSEGCIPLPDAVARNNLTFNTFININNSKTVAPRTTIKSEKGEVHIYADTESLTTESNTNAKGAGAGGVSNATSWLGNTLTNAIWIDYTDLSAAKSINVYADNGGTFTNKGDIYKTHDIGESYAKLGGIGKVVAESRITGTQINQIRSNNRSQVTWKAPTVVHEASAPASAILQTLKADTKVTKVLGIPLASSKKKNILEWYVFDRCDFCLTGREYDVKPTEQETLEERYEDAFKKALAPINEIQRVIADIGVITKARYGEEDNKIASKIFVLDVQSMLNKDVRLTAEEIEKYTMWLNIETFHMVYLMPNAARLFTGAGNSLQYVTELLSGDVLKDNSRQIAEIVTALTEYAFNAATIPVGSTGSLNLADGTLRIPEGADYELYLDEVSANWMRDRINEGTIRRLDANQSLIDASALGDASSPEGTIVEGLTEAGAEGNKKVYWMNTTPEQAESDEQVLLMLLVDEETDEIDAFRTNRRMIKAGEEAIDVSVLLYRDSDADRKGELRYNAMFFDTPEGEPSLFKVITYDLGGATETPSALQIVLRGFAVDGADKPAYRLNRHVFILCDGSDGEVNALEGAYQASFDGDVFESDYTRIEGIRDGNLVVTVKKGQPVWPERTGEDTAEDIGGTGYHVENNRWVMDNVIQQVMSADAN